MVQLQNSSQNYDEDDSLYLLSVYDVLGIELDFTGIVSFTACKTPDVDTSIISIFTEKEAQRT